MDAFGSNVSRRRLLQGGLGVAAGLAVPAVLAGCAGQSTQPAVSSSSPAKRGGRLRAGVLGADNETLNVIKTASDADFTRVAAIFDQLVLVIGDTLRLSLAESLTPNADATVWRIKLREATFHDGRPVTADDVAYTFRFLSDPAGYFGPTAFESFDLKRLKAIDERTLQVPLTRPRADFMELLEGICYVFPKGITDFTKPVGSGPFQVVSYEPGKSAVLKAYQHYWGGTPLLDELEIATINDADAALRAVKSGQLDYAVGISPTSARVEASNPSLQILDGGPANSHALVWTMNTTKPPFNDIRVRQAMAYATDRQALVTIGFGKYGAVGNDVIGQGLPGFDASLAPRGYDPDKARQLLAAAGQPNLSFTVRTYDAPPGSVAATQLWVQQLAKVGVTAKLDTVPASDRYDNAAQNAALIQLGVFINRSTIIHIETFMTPTVPVGISGGYAPKAFNDLVAKAQRTVDPAARQDVINQLSKMLYDEGPYVVWGYANNIDVAAAGVRGVVQSQTLPLFGSASVG